METITDVDYANYLALENTSSQLESQLHSLEQAKRSIDLNENSDETEFLCSYQNAAISSLNGTLVYTSMYHCIYLGSNISSTETDINIRIGMSWTAIDRLTTIKKSDLPGKIKWEFFQVVTMSVILNGCTTLTLMKHMKKKLDGNYTRMLRAVLNNPGSNTLLYSSSTATYLPFQWDE